MKAISGGALPRRRFYRAFVPGAWLAALVPLLVSCADIPTRPRVLVHVTGSVTDRDGSPVAGARLLFGSFDAFPVSPRFPSTARTDSTGSFAIDLYESRYFVRIVPPQDSGLPLYRVFEARVDPLHARIDYRFSGYWVRGRILDPTGQVLADASLYAFRDVPNWSDEYFDARIDSSGFSLLLPAGTYRLRAAPPTSGTGFPTATLAAVPIASDTTLSISLAGDPLTGTITGPLGAPIADALLLAQGPEICSGTTDVGGTYRLYLPPGIYALELLPSAGTRAMDPPPLPYVSMGGPSTFDIAVTGITWSGTVRFSTTGDPMEGAAVGAQRIRSYGSFPVDTTDASGSFRLLVQPGRGYTIRIASAAASFQDRWISPVIAGNDSTFDLLVDPPGATAAWRLAP